MIATKRLFTAIEKSIIEQNLDTLNAYLSSTDISGAFNDRTLSSLGHLLEKCEDDKLMPADCVLSCLQHFVDKKISPDKWEAISESVGKLCEIIFNISATHIKDAQLVKKNVSVFTAILDTRSVVANSMLQFTMHTLLTVASDDFYSHAVRMDLLTLISSIMSQSKREHRKEIIPTKTSYFDNLSNTLPTCGDYEMQVAIVEILTRSWNCLKDEVNTNAALFTKFPNVMELFKKHNFTSLDTEGRLFLKVVNSAMGDNQLVFSIPCVAVMIDQLRYKKPYDLTYKEFWVDFNVGPKSVSFYHQTSPEEPWELKTIYGDNTYSAKAVNSTCRSRSGEVITTIKLEIIFREEEENSKESKSLKIYARKCKEFEKLEEKAIKEIFQDKYESAVTFEELQSPPDAPAKKQPDSNESKHEEEHSPAANNSSYILKWLTESEYKKSDKTYTPLSGRNGPDQELNESQDDSRHSRSFSDYIKQLKEQESNNQSKDQNVTLVPKDTVETNQNLINSEIVGIQALSNINKRTPLNSLEKKINKINPQGIMSYMPDELPATFKEPNAKRRRLFSNETNDDKDLVMSSQEDCSAEVPNYKLCAKEETKIKPKQNVDRTKITYSYIAHKEKQTDKICNGKSVYTNRKIFSDTSDEEDQVCAKKDDESTVERNQKNKPYPFSSTPHPNYSSDKKLLAFNKTSEDVEISNIFPSTSLYPNRFASEKDTHFKKTYARPKASRFSLEKRKKTVFNQILFSSDSDDWDFIHQNIKPPTFEVSDHKGGKKKVTLNLDRYFAQYPLRPDPIRNIKHVPDDMRVDLEPSNVMEVDTPREIEVGPPVEPEPVCDDIPKKGRGRKKGGAAKKNAPKKNAPKKNAPKKENKVPEGQAKNVQTRKPRAKKVLDCSEKLVENELMVQNACPTTCTENDKSKGNEESADCYLAIDVQTRQLIKNSESPEPPSANLVYMKKCLSEADIRVRNVLTHAQKEREMYCSTFSFKTHSSVSVLQDQIKKLVVINNNLLQVKALLDSTTELQNEVYLEIEKEVNALEETKHSFLKNLSNVEETQSSKIASMFQELGKFLKNFALSLFQGNATKK